MPVPFALVVLRCVGVAGVPAPRTFRCAAPALRGEGTPSTPTPGNGESKGDGVMPGRPRRLPGLLPLLLAATTVALAAGEPAVRQEADGRLKYEPDVFGNTVLDFSRAGYRHGGVALPVAPVAVTIDPGPGGGDDTARLQAALDQVARLPARDGDGVRGAVLLRSGTFRCGGTLRVAPGVTLRGEGPTVAGTVVIATRVPTRESEKPTLIHVGGEHAGLVTGEPHEVLDATVPLGGTRIRVARAAEFAAGDAVLIERQPNAAWIHDLKMDQIGDLRDGGKQWKPEGYVRRWEARVAAVAGSTLVLDTPILCALERRYDASTIRKVTADARGRAAAVESVRLVSVYAAGRETSDEAHAWNAIVVNDVVDSWVRDVTALHFAYSGVTAGRNAGRITVQDCAVLEPVSQITGGRRYSFVGSGQFVLFQRCYTRHGRHDFVNGSSDLGPTVFLDCLAERTHADIGPHHRWASGNLYDNVKGGQIHVQDRGRSGTGHGWAGNAQVFWNCEAESFLCQKAWIPSAQNWIIGGVGARGKPALPGRPDGWWESFGRHVAPRSLYLAQLSERISREGGDAEAAIRAVTTPAQRAGTVWTELQARYAAER